MPQAAWILVFLFPSLALARSGQDTAEQEVRSFLETQDRAAARSDAQQWLDGFAPDAVVLGTAPGERWPMAEFSSRIRQSFRGQSRPWEILTRHVTVAEDGRTAWFDDVQQRKVTGTLRRSGVLRRDQGSWKLVQMNTVLPVPNELVGEMVPLLDPGPAGTVEPRTTGEAAALETLQAFHRAGEAADSDGYLGRLSENAVFLGTDLKERWNRTEYQALLEPVFAAGRGPRTRVLEQHVSVRDDGRFAWFDEQLQKPGMGLARGSGVLRKDGEQWRIVHYHLAFLVPNEALTEYLGKVGSHDPEGFTRPRTAQELQQDLDRLKDTLETWHPALYRYETREEVDRLFREARAGLQGPLTPLEFERILAPLVARVHCVHTRILPTLAHLSMRRRQGTYLPVRLRVLGDRLYHESHREVLAIQGTKTAQVLASLRAVIPADGYIRSRQQADLDRDFTELYSVHIGSPQQFTVTLAAENGTETEDVVWKALTWDQWRASQPPSSRSAPGSLPEVRWQPALNAATLRIPTFQTDNPVPALKIIDEFFQELAERKVRHLTLDLRGNGGGHPEYGASLLTYLLKEPFEYLRLSGRSLTPVETLAMGRYTVPRRPSAHRFDGDLFVLMDGGCSSTTGHVLSLIKYHQRAVFVGRVSGATWSCNDNSRDMTLPNTGIQVHIARTTFETAVTGLAAGKGITPDHLVEPTIQDVLWDRDRDMELVESLVRQLEKR